MLYLFLANGFEEIEALATVDIIRRADIEINTVGVGGEYITGSHNITVKADKSLSELQWSDDIDGVILPGGIPGTPNLEACEKVVEFLLKAYNNNKLVAAICAAPSVLGHKGILENKSATCYPGFEKELVGANVVNAPCVTDSNVITGKGAGTALEFAFAIVDYITGDGKISKKLKDSMQCIQ